MSVGRFRRRLFRTPVIPDHCQCPDEDVDRSPTNRNSRETLVLCESCIPTHNFLIREAAPNKQEQEREAEMGSVHRLIVPLFALLLVQTLSTVAEAAKLRFLALHGYNGNAASLCQTFSTWDQSILKVVEFNCLNGPFQNSKDAYIWLNIDSGSRSSSRVDESLAYVLDYMRNTGPYDGIMGFSMGGVMAGLVAGVQAKSMVILGRKSGDLPHLRFAIIDQGGYIKGLLEEVFDPPLSTKSFHIIGNYDPNRQIEEYFIPKWKNPTIARVNMGHSYMTGQYMDDNFKWNLMNFLKSH